jgi:penicillin-binding protein 2
MVRPKKSPVLDFRILFLALLMVGALTAIAIRLCFLQLGMNGYYRSRIQSRPEVTVRIPAIRGEIRDRNGVVLVTNRPSHRVELDLPELVTGYQKQYGQPPMVEYQAEDSDRMLRDRKEADIVQILDRMIIPRLEELKVAEPYNVKRLRTHYRNNALLPFTYREDLDFATFAMFAEKNLGLPGVHLNIKPVRKYVYHAMAAQILGYVGVPEDTNSLADRKDFDFYEHDVQGRTNLEYYHDAVLRGKPGKRILRKSAVGKTDDEWDLIEPTAGANVYLTIDARMQYIAERAIRSAGRAACVVVDPNNGQILAMASVPSYDPNSFIPTISARDWAALKEGVADPLTNRAVSAYAPGSTYKIVTALAGLSMGLEKARFTCAGGVSYGNTFMKCWIAEKHRSHGPQTLTEAIKNSCNAYFYQYGNAAGIEAIGKIGGTLGLGEPSGVELSWEDPGLLPSPDWLNGHKQEKWSQGQTANTSIGQGYVLANPLQMAMVAATVANGGTAYKPSLVHQIQEADGTIVQQPKEVRGNLLKENRLREDQIELIRRGMWRVVNDPDGTGGRARIPGITVAGKTGTAQFWREGKKDNHTWFVAFAPYENPKIALAVLVQGAKAGGQVPAPIAAKIIEEIMALDRGYDPGVKALDPAVGNFQFVESIDFRDTALRTQSSASDEETPAMTPNPPDVRRKVTRAQTVKPDIRPEADDHQTPRRPESVQPEKQRSFFDFFRRKSKEMPPSQRPQQQSEEQKKKKRFLFF